MRWPSGPSMRMASPWPTSRKVTVRRPEAGAGMASQRRSDERAKMRARPVAGGRGGGEQGRGDGRRRGGEGHQDEGRDGEEVSDGCHQGYAVEVDGGDGKGEGD